MIDIEGEPTVDFYKKRLPIVLVDNVELVIFQQHSQQISLRRAEHHCYSYGPSLIHILSSVPHCWGDAS